ncbi:MAG: magnesium-dependent phosphatase-1, partial [Planctomycetota bacterium]
MRKKDTWMKKLPELVVFDLDFTLWDCGGTWCDCLRPPFARKDGQVYDSYGYHVRLYDDVPEIITDFLAKGCRLALASRTERPRWAEQLIRLLDVEKHFHYKEIYPSEKTRHFRSLQNDSG